MSLITLQNDFWQAGILPQTGASVAFGRARQGDGWRDLIRPTAEADYGTPGKCGSFLMLPWCNRIRDGKLRFGGQTYPLQITPGDVTARHGEGRNHAWTVAQQTEMGVLMTLDSRTFDVKDWPFAYTAQAEYRLDGADFVWTLVLRNEDTRPMPAGFGHHPYFVRPAGENAPMLTVPCDSQFDLVEYMAVAPPTPITPRLDFRSPRTLDGSASFNDLLSERQGDAPARLVYPGWGIAMEMYADAIFKHILVYTPPGESSVAVEPMTNASDGFNLYAEGIPGSGVFMMEPGESVKGEVRLRLVRV